MFNYYKKKNYARHKETTKTLCNERKFKKNKTASSTSETMERNIYIYISVS